MKTKTKIILGGLLIAAQVAVFPYMVFANGSAAGPVSAIPISDGGTLASNAVFQVAFTPIVTANNACVTAEGAYQKANSAAQAGFSGLSLISGGSSLLTQLNGQLAAYNGFLTCRQAVATSLTVLPTTNLYNDNQRQSLLTQVNAAIQTWKSRIDDTTAKINNASQGFWKTLVFNILIQTSKSVADALVTKLVNNYKITNVKQYADSVATLMYDNQYLSDNFPGALDQGMARAILNQPELRNQIQPGIYVAANAALGFAPSTLSPTDPQFYQKMAMVGSSPANPYFLQASYVSGVDQAHAQALAQANAQIAQSQGYKTPVNCAGSLAQQQQIDTQVKAAQDQMANRAALLASLQAAGSAANPSDVAKAQSDYNNSVLAWQNLPYAVTGSSSVSSLSSAGGNNTEGTLAIDMCEAISSPANLINKGIDQAFNAVGVNMAQYNNNNLPSFISLIGNVASQIGTSLIFGGAAGAQGAALVNEGSLVNGAVTSVNQTTANNSAAATTNSIVFVVTPTGSNNYQVTWNVDSTALPGADHVLIVGSGLASSPIGLPLLGQNTLTTSTGGTYTLTVYDANNNILATRSLNVNPSSNSAAVASPPTGITGTISISPSSGAIVAGSNISIICSNLSAPAGSVVSVDVNNVSNGSILVPINNGSCLGTVAVNKANNFISSGPNTINAWVGDSTGTQITGAPDVTATLSVSGQVLGASTQTPNLETRGPVVVFAPRGQ